MVGDKDILKLIGDALPVVAIAATGGFVSFLREGKWSPLRLLANVTGSGFSGLIVYACLSDTGISAGYMCAVAGIVGSSGGAMLERAQDMLLDMAHRYIGAHHDHHGDFHDFSRHHDHHDHHDHHKGNDS